MGKISRVAALVTVSVLLSACAVSPYDPYYDGVAPSAARFEYPGYPPASDYRWGDGYSYRNWGGGHRTRDTRPRPAPGAERASASRYERDVRRSPEPAPVYRQQRGNAPRAEHDARPAPERQMNFRADHHDRQRSERQDDRRAHRTH